ncbi:MAG: ABC transporter ATP-binding protein [Acidobacteriota bacterium]
MNAEFALRCEALVKTFDGTRAVDDLSVEIPAGQIFGLLGPNGSGKTTTVRLALGIYVPDGGYLQVLGREDPLAVRDRLGYLPEERGLYPRMRIGEQLAFLGTIRGLPLGEANRRARNWLDRLGLGERARSQTNELSKGMQQKVQFAAAVIHDPALVVLDEPFSGLDPVNTRLLRELILEQRQRGTTVVLSTHRMDQVEQMCESICLIHQGRAVLSGGLSDIKASYGKSTIKLEYDGEANALKQLDGVREVRDSGREASLLMDNDAHSQQVLRQLLERVTVRSFALAEPSVEDIFLDKVGYDPGKGVEEAEHVGVVLPAANNRGADR